MSAIEHVHARQILDSRGNPTTEVDVRLASGVGGRAAVPSASAPGTRRRWSCAMAGRPLAARVYRRAVENVNGEIAAAVTELDADDQRGLDEAMIRLDGTDGKLSARRERDSRRLYGCGAGGVRRSGRAVVALLGWRGGEPAASPDDERSERRGARDNPVDFQEFMIAPVGATSFAQAIQMGAEVYHELQRTLKSRGLGTAVGDEGGFAPALDSNEAPLELIVSAIGSAEYSPGADIAICLDPAASEFFKDGRYELAGEGRSLSSAEMVEYWETIADRYPVVSLEDGMAEGDWEGWRNLTEELGSRVQLVGDDVFVTDPAILREGIERGIANSILIKLNQIGTLTETLDTITIARDSGYRAVISHRSGETEDTFIADLVVATGVGQIKTGAPARSERVAKYNQLLRIEEELGKRAALRRESRVALV